jgi:hypothetical protein
MQLMGWGFQGFPERKLFGRVLFLPERTFTYKVRSKQMQIFSPDISQQFSVYFVTLLGSDLKNRRKAP